ncbi:hypothetical protein SAMN02927916_1623 [Flavobacterium anhuiense]|uniref:Competence protein n=1 Tax=Flavobacterium anhuiense TaxID=459526 RepID=A0ABY0LJW2_9FLAO|nr:hypothetical protein [Flavobacterium anhuiense]SCY25364.1 hypothetical protein SAMN02927916_1623 [Flavobacterium anhuiense]
MINIELNKTVEMLEKFNYKYKLRNSTITVTLDFSQNVVIDLSNPSKIIIRDHLENWNFLTGCIKMSLKNAILYNFILLLFFGFLCQYLQFTGNSLTNLFLTFMGWILLFSTYYLIKLEGFKLQLKTIIK